MARGAMPRATAAAVSHRIVQIKHIEMLTRGLSETLGVEEVPYGELLLGVEAVNRARLERGADPLI